MADVFDLFYEEPKTPSVSFPTEGSKLSYLSTFSGIESASVAWHPLGWEPLGFSEVNPFASAVLAHRFPSVQNFGDVNEYRQWKIAKPVDLLVGGSPCQSFSMAGLRKGMDDPRGNLALVFLGALDLLRPRWVLWENVPGVLSADGGRAFGSILGGMVELGYGVAYRVLDAQFFGVPQRRKRVFVVGYLGDYRRAAAVLLERSGMQGNPPTSGKAWDSDPIAPSGDGRGNVEPPAGSVIVSDPFTYDAYAQIANKVSHPLRVGLGNGRGDEIPIMIVEKDHEHDSRPIFRVPHAYRRDALTAIGPDQRVGMTLRRITPTEAERLQGFPDGHTLISSTESVEVLDGLRYKSLGNSMAVPVMRWLGQRIGIVDAMKEGAF